MPNVLENEYDLTDRIVHINHLEPANVLSSPRLFVITYDKQYEDPENGMTYSASFQTYVSGNVRRLEHHTEHYDGYTCRIDAL